MDLRGYPTALVVSSAIFLAGFVAGCIHTSLTEADPSAVAEAVVESAPVQAASVRVQAVQIAVEAVAAGLGARSPELAVLSTALGIFFTNFVTCYGAALTPLIPLVWLRRVTPWAVKRLGRRCEPEAAWRRYYRPCVPLAPAVVLALNGYVFYLVLDVAGGVLGFMVPELGGLLALASVGVRASLSSGSPELLEESYEGFWSAAFYGTLFLMVSSFMEANLFV